MPYGDIATDKAFINGQLGVDGQDLNDILGKASIQPAFYSGQVSQSAPSDTDTLLVLTAGGLFRRNLYSNFFNQNRVRSSIGQVSGGVGTLINGDMAIWQRNTTFSGVATGSYLADRFRIDKVTGSNSVTVTQIDLAGSLVGSAFNHQPRYALRAAASVAESPLNAGDFLTFTQRVEKQRARMLFDNVSSLQVWVRASIAGTVSVVIRNADHSQFYKQDFSIGTPNVWQRLTLQNIPVMPTASGSWGTLETDEAYEISIVLYAGTTFQSSVMSTWTSGNMLCSASQTNFMGTLGNTFDMCLWQHESGPVCTPFSPMGPDSNLLLCQRYRYQSYEYGTFQGTVTNAGAWTASVTSTSAAFCSNNTPIRLRITPTIPITNIFGALSGANSKVSNNGTSADVAITAVGNPSQSGFLTLSSSAAFTAANMLFFHVVIDAEL